VLHLDPPKIMYDWHAAYCANYNADETVPHADQWFVVYGDEGQVLATSGEQYLKDRDTLFIKYLYADPSRAGVGAIRYIFATYQKLIEYNVFSAIAGETLYKNRSIRLMGERYGFVPQSVMYTLGTPRPNKVA
jgi:hypothetical protein